MALPVSDWLPVLASFLSGVAGVVLGGKIGWDQYRAAKQIDINEKLQAQCVHALVSLHQVCSVGAGDSAAAMVSLARTPQDVLALIWTSWEACGQLWFACECTEVCQHLEQIQTKLDRMAVTYQVLANLLNTRDVDHKAVHEHTSAFIEHQAILRSQVRGLRALARDRFALRPVLHSHGPIEV